MGADYFSGMHNTMPTTLYDVFSHINYLYRLKIYLFSVKNKRTDGDNCHCKVKPKNLALELEDSLLSVRVTRIFRLFDGSVVHE